MRAFIVDSVAPGTMLRTDAFSTYPYVVEGYAHAPVNVLRSGKKGHEALPGVHRLFALFKRWIDGVYQGGVQAGHLQEYLDEFTFRFNRRRSRARGMLFYRLLERAVSASPVTYRDLVKEGAPKGIDPSGTAARRVPGTLAVEAAGRPWRKTQTPEPTPRRSGPSAAPADHSDAEEST